MRHWRVGHTAKGVAGGGRLLQPDPFSPLHSFPSSIISITHTIYPIMFQQLPSYSDRYSSFKTFITTTPPFPFSSRGRYGCDTTALLRRDIDL